MRSHWTFHRPQVWGRELDSERNCPPWFSLPLLPTLFNSAETASTQMGKDLLTPKVNGSFSMALRDSLRSNSLSPEAHHLLPMDVAPISIIQHHLSLVNLFPIGYSLQANFSTVKVSMTMTKLIITKFLFPAKPPLLREPESKLPILSLFVYPPRTLSQVHLKLELHLWTSTLHPINLAVVP